ncbi:MAG: hypothetical protein HRT45_01080 [Bdellovibrionales bacterium]|nr:hypothetical protein [Bdellovibrionales bacterium]
MFNLAEDGIMYFEGAVSEAIPEETFVKEFLGAVEPLQGDHEYVPISFEKASHINSVGVKTLLAAMSKTSAAINIVNSPVWLVDQFKMIHGFFGEKHIATSFYFPYFNDEKGEEHFRLLEIAKDFDLSKDFGSQEFQTIVVDEAKFEPDEDGGDYFSFLLPLEERIRSYISAQK